MDSYLRSQNASRALVVTCLHYQTSSITTPLRYLISVASEGVELRAITGGSSDPSVASAASSIFSRKQKRDSLEVIPWSDILGAEILSSSTSHHELSNNDPRADDDCSSPSAAAGGGASGSGCAGTVAPEPAMDFVIHGCIAKGRAKRVQNLSPSGGCDKPAKEPVERMMGSWSFRYVGADGIKTIPPLVSLIQSMADPRTHAFLNTHKTSPTLRRRKYLVYINPVGGSGRAKHTYKSVVAPIFAQSNIDCEVVVTQHQAHATEHVLQMPLDTYDCVVSIGGDGLLSEILQGLMKREDWKRAIRQPLGVIPGGSGNGLSAALLVGSNERLQALNAGYALAKGSVHDLDIATVLNSHQEVMYSFLSLEWAFIADVDMESEKFRMFGGLRFTISAVAKILGSQIKNAGKLRYLCSENDTIAPPKYHERHHGFDGELAPAFDCFASRPEQKVPHVKGEWKELEGDFHLFWGMNVSHGAADAHVAPGARIDDGYYHLLCVPAPFSRIELAKVLLGLETGVHVNQKHVRVIRTRAFTLQVDNAADLLVVDGERFKGPQVQVEVHRGLGRIMCLPRSA